MAASAGQTRPLVDPATSAIHLEQTNPKPDVMVRLRNTIGDSSSNVFESAPGVGLVRLQMVGAGAAVNVQFNAGGPTYALLQGAALASGSWYEFEFAVDRGDTPIVASGPTNVRAFWRPGK